MSRKTLSSDANWLAEHAMIRLTSNGMRFTLFEVLPPKHFAELARQLINPSLTREDVRRWAGKMSGKSIASSSFHRAARRFDELLDEVVHEALIASRLERVLTVADVAQNMKVRPSSVRQLIASGQLRSVKVGRAVRIPASAITDFLNADRVSR